MLVKTGKRSGGDFKNLYSAYSAEEHLQYELSLKEQRTIWSYL